MGLERSADRQAVGAAGRRLQLALDGTSIEETAQLVRRLGPELTRLEVGTPLVLSAGLDVVKKVRSMVGHRVTVVADVKICDAGERIAQRALAAGADVITVVASVVDETTWRGVLRAVREFDGERESATVVLLDTIGSEVELSGLELLAEMARGHGVEVELCIHRPKHGSTPFDELIAPFAGLRDEFAALVVAGKLTPGEARAALAAGFDTLVVGGAVADALEPEKIWRAFQEAVEAELGQTKDKV
jgi:3-keto-L-gulonate-6-phosphate decarboxylase